MVEEILRCHSPLETRDESYNGTPLGWTVYGSAHGRHPEVGDYASTVLLLLGAGAQAPPLASELEASDAVRAVLAGRVRRP